MATTSVLDRPTFETAVRPSQRAGLIDLAPQRARTPEQAAAWFEQVYRDAQGDAERIPWAGLAPNPCLVAWMNAMAPTLVRPGGRVAVVGCGLGHDAVELINRGYDVLGFDVSPTAVEWARRLHPQHAERFAVCDLWNLPSRLKHRFDLVVESYTIQSVPPAMRESMAQPLADLLGPHGVLLAICRGRGPETTLDSFDAPPYPLTPDELTSLMSGANLRPAHPMSDFDDDETPPIRRLRAAFRRA